MRKLFTLLCAILLTAQFAVAQNNLYVISKTGELTYYPATKVLFDNDLFTITYGKITSITLESFATSFEVSFKSSEVKSLGQRSEIGICFSDANTTPTIKDGIIKLGTKLGNYSFSLNNLDAGTTYYYRAYVKIGDALFYGDIRNETTFGKAPSYTIINGHKFVDLDLPSGLLWATCNVGAATAAGVGNYYAWGETEPQTSNSYSWDSYKYGTSSSNLTKYNSSDGKTTLDSEDDAAYVNWGDSCRMPTIDEFGELLNSDNCTWTWATHYNYDGFIRGYEVTSVKNGSSIFLPAAGYRDDVDLDEHGSLGHYWSSTLNARYSDWACYLYFDSSRHPQESYDDRCIGCTIRPVAEP